MAAGDQLAGGARHGGPVDAAVGIEAAVLVTEQHRQIARVDLGGRGRQTPPAVGQGEGAQQPIVAVDDHRRAEPRRGEVKRAEMLEIGVPRRRDAETEGENQRADEREETAFAAARGSFPPCGGRRRAQPDG